MKYQIASYSHKGQRKQNEDAYKAVLCDKQYYPLSCFIVVADGMGGMGGGDIASQTAVNSFEHWLLKKNRSIRVWNNNSIKGLLNYVIKQVNNDVLKKGKQSANTKEMGTTLTAVLLFDDRYVAANVGDSRAYLINEDNIAQITKDHTALQDALESGAIEEDEASKYIYANALTRSIGSDKTPNIDIHPVSMASDGDMLLICSDGFYKFVKEEYIQNRLNAASDVQTTLEELVSLAIENGSDDNLTVAALRFSNYNKRFPLKTERKPIKKNIKKKSANIISMLFIILVFLIILINEEVEFLKPPFTIGLFSDKMNIDGDDPRIYGFSNIMFSDFSNEQTNDRKLYTIHNRGTKELVITNLTVSGQDSEYFHINEIRTPLSILPNDSYEIEIIFYPVNNGIKKGALIIENNDPFNNPFIVSLSAIGYEENKNVQ